MIFTALVNESVYELTYYMGLHVYKQSLSTTQERSQHHVSAAAARLEHQASTPQSHYSLRSKTQCEQRAFYRRQYKYITRLLEI